MYLLFNIVVMYLCFSLFVELVIYFVFYHLFPFDIHPCYLYFIFLMQCVFVMNITFFNPPSLLLPFFRSLSISLIQTSELTIPIPV